MTQVTCKNCKNNVSSWMTRNFSDSAWWRCGLEQNRRPMQYNPVDGKTRGGQYESCGIARLTSGACGPDAQHWTPRNKRDLFVFLKRV